MTINLTDEEYKIVIAGLLELPAKQSLMLLSKLENQTKNKPMPVTATVTKEVK